MAFYEDKNDDQDDPNLNGQGPQTSVGSGVIDAGTAGGSSNAPKASAAPGTPDKPGNFVGIKDYLNANRTQSAKLGNQFAGGLNNEIGDANQAIGGVGNQFGQKVQAGQIGGFENAVSEGQGLINKAATTGQINDDEKKRYGEISNASYAGPKTLQDAADVYQPVADKVNKATTDANLTKTEAGNQQLLRGMNQSPNYTTGAQRFDSYLLNDAGTQQKLADARTGASGLQGQLDTQGEAAAAQATQAQQRAQATQDAVRAAFGKFDDPSTPENEAAGALGNYQGNIQQELAGAKTNSDALAGRVASGKLTGDDINSLGLSNMPTYGVDLKNYFQQGIPTEAGVTTPEQKAQYDALMSLGGGTSGLYGGASPQDFGSYSPSADAGAYKQAVGDAKNMYEVTKPQQLRDQLLNYFNSHGADAAGDGIGANLELNQALDPLRSASSADDILKGYNSLEAWQKGHGQTTDYATQTALRDYLMNQLPALRSGSLADNAPALPTNPDGTIDYGSIKPPSGGPGKGGAPTPVVDTLPPKKKG